MIDLFDNAYQNTLKDTSYDDTNDEYMTESTYKVIDFDLVKDAYIKSLSVKDTPNSNDALVFIENQYYFIEFKNANIRNHGSNIRKSIYDSLLILLDLIKQNITFARENVNYILVYNYDKSKKIIEKVRQERDNSKLGKNEIQTSPSFFDFHRALDHLAETQTFDILGLSATFQNLYFKNVLSYDKDEFEKLFVEKYLTDS